ncbi:hypothetical protein SRABI106_00032 [Rahnella aquatilis]|nr:hypothetical protein SRABI106_00032 [Rahnella aquatilis]
MFDFSKKGRESFLKRMGHDLKIKKESEGWVNIRAIPERKLIDTENEVSATIYITADADEVLQGNHILLNGEVFEISYIDNDLSGLVDCYLSLIGDENGRTSKYV